MIKNNSGLIPYVIEKEANGERSYDLYSRMLEDRIVFISGEVGASMETIAAEIMYLDSLDKEKPIFLYINSPGGSVVDGEVLLNVMDACSAPIYTICTGMAASMGAVIFSNGTKGHRYMMPMSDIMMHQVSSGTEGNIQDQRIELQYTEALNERLMRKLAKNCGKTYQQILKDTTRDCWLSPEEAVEYGIADAIFDPKKIEV